MKDVYSEDLVIGDTVEFIYDTFESEEIDSGKIYDTVEGGGFKVRLDSDPTIRSIIEKDTFGRWYVTSDVEDEEVKKEKEDGLRKDIETIKNRLSARISQLKSHEAEYLEEKNVDSAGVCSMKARVLNMVLDDINRALDENK